VAPRRTLYPFVNTHSAGATPTKGYTANPHEGLHRQGGFQGLPGIRRWEVRAVAAQRGVLAASAPFLIHRSAWKGRPPKYF